MSTRCSHSPKRSLSSDGAIFTGNWLAKQGLAGYSLDSVPSDQPLASDSNIPASRTQAPLESKVYGTRDWADVPNTTDASRPPPAPLSKLVPSAADFESWLERIQSVSALEHHSESRLRAAQDARLLSALRNCHSAHKNHMRRLEDARALAINILRSPFIRRISAAQGVDLRMRADRRADAMLLEIDGDSGLVSVDGGSVTSSDSHDSFSASASVSMEEESNLSEESDESTGAPIVISSDEYEDASPGEKRGRRGLVGRTI
ncbi:hypothetical protein PENSPDRAFT_694736 [Peniophora sp. CONT]|nr:hypothetical protein PENSPDRAFT_694736 [Peniophora sp. CONT]